MFTCLTYALAAYFMTDGKRLIIKLLEFQATGPPCFFVSLKKEFDSVICDGKNFLEHGNHANDYLDRLASGGPVEGNLW